MPDKERTVAFLQLYQGLTFVRVPRLNLILGIKPDVKKVSEILDDNGKNKFVDNDPKQPLVNVNAGIIVLTYTEAEYAEFMSIIDHGGQK